MKSMIMMNDFNAMIARLLNKMMKDFEKKVTMFKEKTLCEAITEE